MSGAALGSASWMRVKSPAHPAKAASLAGNINDTNSIKIRHRMMHSRARDRGTARRSDVRGPRCAASDIRWALRPDVFAPLVVIAMILRSSREGGRCRGNTRSSLNLKHHETAECEHEGGRHSDQADPKEPP